MSQIKTHAKGVDMHTCYHDIAYLLNEGLANGSLPFTQEKPPAQNTNIISGRHCGDINSTALELKAASIGAKNSLWIFGADAEFLGLELKDSNPKEYQNAKKENPRFNCEPVLMFAQVRERMGQGNTDRVNVAREGAGVDVQCAYLLDQFSEASVRRVFRQQKLEQTLGEGTVDIVARRRSEIASQIIKNMAVYDAIPEEREKAIQTNLQHNLSKDGAFFKAAAEEYKKITESYSPAQKTVFNVCRKYYTAQLSGSRLQLNEAEKTQFTQAFQTLQKESAADGKPEIVARTVFQAQMYAERSTHYAFSLEPIYRESELREKVINQTAVKNPRQAQALRDTSYSGSILNEQTKRNLLNKRHEKIRSQGFER